MENLIDLHGSAFPQTDADAIERDVGELIAELSDSDLIMWGND